MRVKFGGRDGAIRVIKDNRMKRIGVDDASRRAPSSNDIIHKHKDDVQILDSDEIAKKKLQKLKEMYKPLTDWYKQHLGRQVEKVSISNKLVDAPLFIFTSQYGYSAQMEKINKAQAFANQEKAPGYMLAKKTLELNPHHSVMKRLLEELKESDGDLGEASTEYANLLF